ncbi:MAG: hypothetical protein A2504_12800 [Bdellovibrionales bacterium RIFOXYD12_FULL_39_22]|nr:MAG: hypothetical protein A2385_03885 [Bdellovibrionales bacterium RIFOXYB1_FULL_39_21]OFZ40493.1 MAG: hypothetical protein A2485_02750 [Bdellovibrionales bacterium RIFOXYC12_FULL_39_17]OFZ49976.1 MAG: hypothetical protein A2404_02085 [Bdellovibrionales bacterium RIFOXYC1_FULL_39_130]OFZ77618.1 MAG: hypothetical protein A2560_04645 [Bdellovibrionales bacterium RIFOXYD1_FULL_39_84]OFZ96072.1 MAG: hypothetical protein A2504_12800 [Bdellovibrionales bacterium RIFOXYD12_FULL_39_22]HLE10639.1 hy
MNNESSDLVKFKKKFLRLDERIISSDFANIETVSGDDEQVKIGPPIKCLLIVADSRLVFFKAKWLGDYYFGLDYLKIAATQRTTSGEESVITISLLNLDKAYKITLSNKTILDDFEMALQQNNEKAEIKKGTSFEKLAAFKK